MGRVEHSIVPLPAQNLRAKLFSPSIRPGGIHLLPAGSSLRQSIRRVGNGLKQRSFHAEFAQHVGDNAAKQVGPNAAHHGADHAHFGKIVLVV